MTKRKLNKGTRPKLDDILKKHGIDPKQFNVEKPYMDNLKYIRGILKHRNLISSYDKLEESLNILEKAYLAGIELSVLKDIASNADNYSKWVDTIDDLTYRKQKGL